MDTRAGRDRPVAWLLEMVSNYWQQNAVLNRSPRSHASFY